MSFINQEDLIPRLEQMLLDEQDKGWVDAQGFSRLTYNWYTIAAAIASARQASLTPPQSYTLQIHDDLVSG